MFGLETLDILIGLVTIYLAFAVACTACVEAISAWLGFRSTNLHKALGGLLDGNITTKEPFVDAFYEHPLVKALSKGDGKAPSYIPPAVVGKVIESIVLAKTGVADLDKAIEALPDGAGKDLLRVLNEEAGQGVGEFRRLVATQFDATMDRASGWFKRKTQLVTLCVSAILVVTLNVDTVAIATSLSANPEARAELAKIAGQQLHQAEQARVDADANGDANAQALKQMEDRTVEARASLEQATASVKAAGLPLGWGSAFASGADWDAASTLTKIFGLVLSIFAISLGAPFWFNVLDRFNAVRTSGVRQTTPQAESQRRAQTNQAGPGAQNPAAP